MIRNTIKRIPGAHSVAHAVRRSRRVLSRLVFGKPQSEQYDLEAIEVIKRTLVPNSSGIDIGANKGDLLAHIVRLAPMGQHWAFEPEPRLAIHLQNRFPNVTVLPYALAEVSGRTRFYVTTQNRAYSSLDNRDPAFLDKIGLPNAATEAIDVEVRRLDDVIPETARIALIKIDVAGAELRTLAGAMRTIDRCKPIVIVEAGFYGESTSRELFERIRSCGLELSLMSRWLRYADPPRTFDEFLPIAKQHFQFVAHP